MKYKNKPVQLLIRRGLLYLIQQFWVKADIIREMLYFVQELYNEMTSGRDFIFFFCRKWNFFRENV